LISRRLAVAVLAAAFCAIYLPDIGHGFVRDDFHWIRVGVIASRDDLTGLLFRDVGFYRPVVLASFSVNYAFFGLHAFPYALTNLLLLAACAWLVARLSAALGLGPLAATVTAAAWCFNFHAVNMALLWISGRTALLLTLFSLLAVLAAMRRRWWLTATFCVLAMLSKEEAVVLPFFMIWASSAHTKSDHHGNVLRGSWPVWLALVVYLVLRVNSGAFWPGSAPWYYRFTLVPSEMLRNAFEYLDRSTSFAAALALFVTIASRERPRFTVDHRRIFVFAGAWTISSFAITLFLPVRSDLYALAPSIGPALACGAIVDALERSRAIRLHRTLAVLLLFPIVLWPVYRERNVRWVRPADLSTRLLADPAALANATPDEIDDAFAGLLPDAQALVTGPP